MLVLVVGPSGAGKDTLLDAARAILAQDARFRFARREVTRPATAGGEDHVAIDFATFAQRRAAGVYALSWEAHGLGYGIATAEVAGAEVAVASVSRAVLAKAAARFPVRVLQITAPPELLARRLAARGREDAAAVAARLKREVPLPDGLDVATVLNDASVAEGAAKVVAVLNRAAEPATPAGTAPPSAPG